MNRWTALVLASLAACNSSNATTTTTPGESQASSGNGSAQDAASDRADADASAAHTSTAADPRITALLAAWGASETSAGAPRILFGPIAVDDPTDVGPRVVAILGEGARAKLVYTAVPFVAGQQAALALGERDFGEIDPSKITGLAVRRINGDTRPDIAVFTSDERTIEQYVPLQMFTHLFTLRTDPEGERTLHALIRTQLELAGIRTEQELDAQLPTLGRFEAPTAGMSPARFIARLRYATIEQLVSVVPAAGVRLCNDVPDRTGRRRKSCRSVARSAIRGEFAARFNIHQTLAPFAEVEGDDSYQLTTPACQRARNQLDCGANIGGPAGLNWTLSSEGDLLRVAEITAWHEDS